MLPTPPSGDPYLSRLAGILNAELGRKEPTIVGLVYDGTNLLLRFRAPYGVGWITVHVQTNLTGGMTYDSTTSVSSTLVDCRADRLQDQTIAVTAGLRYAIFLVPVQYDGAVPPTKVMYDGEGGRPDAMASVTTWVGLPTAHNLLSASHGDSTAAAAVRGDLITGQGTSPLWTRLAKGTTGQFFKSDGTDIGWAAHGLTYSDVGAAPAAGSSSIVTVGTITAGVWNAGAVTSSGQVKAGTSLVVGTGGSSAAGSIYSDANWGMLFYALQVAPVQADFLWLNSAGVERARLSSTGLTLAAGLSATSLTVGVNQVVGARGAAVADATDAATAITQLNAWLARARAHGLIAV